MIVVDTSGLLAAIDGSQRSHAGAAAALRGAGEPRLLSPFVLAELDCLLATRVSASTARAFLGEVARGAYQLEPFGQDDVEQALGVLERYSDLDLGLADASLIVIAERHFRAVRGPGGRPFRLLPADA